MFPKDTLWSNVPRFRSLPDEELAEPVLALSREEAEDVAEETPEEDPMVLKPWE